MEFYEIDYVSSMTPRLFQFPTGWNSTENLEGNLPSSFSCFNSQRDGILQFRDYRVFFCFSLFQFPTGWNSTQCLSKKKQLMDSFNSQRDGILLMPRAAPNWSWVFQFPTGWNSTRARRKGDQKAYVSIPNGMEFYTALRSITTQVACFNSQRDGILL